MTTLTPSQVIGYWYQAGGSETSAAIALAHAYAESSLNADATSSNPDGGTNVGLYQLDTPGGVGHGYTVKQLEKPLLNTQLTVKATNNGQDWSQYPDAWKNFLSKAQAEVEGYTGTTGGATSGDQPGGASGSGIDSFLSNLLTGITGELLGTLPGDMSSLDPVSAVAAAIADVASEFEGVAKVLTWLTVPSHWVRIFAGIFGSMFLGAGIFLIGKEARSTT